MPDFLWSVNAKLARAHVQARTLTEAVQTWAKAHPIRGRCELRDERLGFRIIQDEYESPPPTVEWGLLVGECIHNLSSALDNLAYALARVEHDPPKRPRGIYFPVFADREKFNANGRKSLDQLPRAAVDAMERLQPFQRTGSAHDGKPEHDPLLLLQALSNTDKHRVPSVVLIAPREIAHQHQVEFRTEEEASMNVPPDVTAWGGPLSPGVVLAEMRTKHPIASVKGRVDIVAIVALETERGPEPLGHILHALATYTGMVVDQLRGFLPAK